MRKATKAFSNPLAEQIRLTKERDAAAQKKNDFMARTQAFGSVADLARNQAKPQPSAVSITSRPTSKGKAQAMLDMKVNKLKGTGRASKLLGSKRGKKSKAIHCLGINDITARSKVIGSNAIIQKVSPVKDQKSVETEGAKIGCESPPVSSTQLPRETDLAATPVQNSEMATVHEQQAVQSSAQVEDESSNVSALRWSSLSSKLVESAVELHVEPVSETLKDKPDADADAVVEVSPQDDGNVPDMPAMRRQYTLPYDEDPTMCSISNDDQLSEEERDEGVSDWQPEKGKVKDIIKAWDLRANA